MKQAEKFLAEKMLSGNSLSRDGVIRLLEEYAELCMDVQAKIIVSQPVVSGNEANQSANKKDGEVAVAFADLHKWIDRRIEDARNSAGGHTTYTDALIDVIRYIQKIKDREAKATDR